MQIEIHSTLGLCKSARVAIAKCCERYRWLKRQKLKQQLWRLEIQIQRVFLCFFHLRAYRWLPYVFVSVLKLYLYKWIRPILMNPFS